MRRSAPAGFLTLALAVSCSQGLAQVLTAAPSQKPLKQPSQDPRIAEIRGLLEAGEKALKAEDYDTLADQVEAAQGLIAELEPARRSLPEVRPLMKRLQALEKALQAATSEETGLKVNEEVVTLTGEDLKAELRRLRQAEAGVTYDFPIDLNDTVATWIHEFCTARKSFLEGALSRATRYLPMIRQVFAEEGVPQDLAFLAAVESGFKNVARSRAKAVGMWQFIRSSGRIYGLDNTAWIDERRDAVKATRAAARYLKRLYEIQGDWYLAMAGYNAGPLTVDRATTALGTRNFWDLARSRFLRTETKNYVPQICAAIIIGRNPKKYGFEVTQSEPLAYEEVEVLKATSLKILAIRGGMDLDTLKDLNSELLRGSTPPGTYRLKVPAGQGLAMMKTLAGIPQGQRLDFKSYVLKRGDTLARVASRFKVAPEDLLAANDLSRTQFRAGRKILVPPAPSSPLEPQDIHPTGGPSTRPLSETPLPNLPTVPGASLTAEPKPVELAQAPSSEAASGRTQASRSARRTEPARMHRIKNGETLFSIANRYGVSVANLRKWNRLKGNRILVGQTLKVVRP